MESAPYFDDIGPTPAPAQAVWATASDGVRVRLCYWPREAAKGTAILLPGRTEYIEKYTRVVADMHEAGLASASIDWRGQGLSDRVGDDPMLGHVGKFLDYQRDLAELLRYLEASGAPRPWYLLAHSMGGAIGLRALINGIDVASAAFSSPMWGIAIPWIKQPVAATVPLLAKRLGREMRLVPGSSPESHILATPFEENLLTGDEDHYAWFQDQLRAHPELSLAGPTIRWLGESLNETRLLKQEERPAIPVLTFLGTREEIVSPNAIYAMHRDWPSARLEVIEGARHEVLMETAEMRSKVLGKTLEHWGVLADA